MSAMQYMCCYCRKKKLDGSSYDKLLDAVEYSIVADERLAVSLFCLLLPLSYRQNTEPIESNRFGIVPLVVEYFRDTSPGGLHA